jgi:acetyltransferase-like isoleucine patch superfamily enzyme
MNLLLVGAGGHARPVAEAATDNGHLVIAYAAPEPAEWLDIPNIGDEEAVPDDVEGFVMGLGGATPAALQRRLDLYRTYAARRLAPVALRHSRAFAAPDAILADGTTVLAGALVNAGAAVGEAAIVNTGAIVEHEAVIGPGVHLAPGAIVLGAARVGECAMIGAGAVVLPGAAVPSGTLVPALARYPNKDGAA